MRIFALVLTAASLALAASAQAESYYLIVGGSGGQPLYEERFLAQADAMASAARRTLGDEALVTVLSGEAATRDAVTREMDRLAQVATADDSVVIFLVGHGSHDGDTYKFNIPGPDIDGDAFAALLNAIPAERQLVVNATSSSGAILETWSAENRLLVTATRSGGERNATRFGEHWAEAMSSDEADANKNGAITVQEAFEFAERMVADSYETAGNLATEHPQLVGDTAGSFNVALLEARIATTEELETLIGELTVLEEEIEILRSRRDEMDGDVYLGQLQELLLELALVQREIDEIRAAE
ncbi:MAG TPA: C13 family peptidase [Gammaproteobacteria bacterium]